MQNEEVDSGPSNDSGTEEIVLEPTPLHAIGGLSSSQTLQLPAHICRQEVVVLIDSGSSNNFINQRLAHKLNLKPTPTQQFKVAVADGGRLDCDKVYRKVPIQLPDLQIQVDLFPIKLIGVDVILGVSWLRSLGNVACNWDHMSMEFEHAGRHVRLVGITEGEIRPASFNLQRQLRQWPMSGTFLISPTKSPSLSCPI